MRFPKENCCVKCGCFVYYYNKHCDECVSKYGIMQDFEFWRTHKSRDVDRDAEFEKDIASASRIYKRNLFMEE